MTINTTQLLNYEVAQEDLGETENGTGTSSISDAQTRKTFDIEEVEKANGVMTNKKETDSTLAVDLMIDEDETYVGYEKKMVGGGTDEGKKDALMSVMKNQTESLKMIEHNSFTKLFENGPLKLTSPSNKLVPSTIKPHKTFI